MRAVDADELGTRLALLPSRRHMTRPKPKSDLIEHTWRAYHSLVRWAHAVGSSHFDATWSQWIRACGYPDTAKVRASLQRYAALLEEAGLARIYGVRDANGAWQRLDVELLEPPAIASLCEAPVAQSG